MALTTKQRKFIEAYSGNATEAALIAGYSKKTAYAIGQENLKKPEIQNAIKQRENEVISELIAVRDERLQFWTKIMRDDLQDMKDRLRASELLGKASGDFIDKVEANVNITPAAILENIRKRRNEQ